MQGRVVMAGTLGGMAALAAAGTVLVTADAQRPAPRDRRADASGAPVVELLPACRLERRRFRTLPRLRPTALCITRARPDDATAEGRLLVTPRPWRASEAATQFGAMIVSDAGRILWFKRARTALVDLKVVRYRGRPHLAMYHQRRGRRNAYEILDHHYRRVARIFAGGRREVDAHELQLSGRGSAYLASYVPVRVRRAGTVTDYVLQEIDLRTGKVRFEWRALDHVPLRASYEPRPRDGSSWDYFHGNSIEPPARRGHTIIASARRTSAVYGIDRRTGRIRWILGGKQDQFGLAEGDPRARFCAQHDARRMANGEITIFDNGGWYLGDERDCPAHPARVLRFRLDPDSRTARLVAEIPSQASSETAGGYRPAAVGSARRQPDDDMLISWGSTGRITQVTPSGHVEFRLWLDDRSYRAVRADDWVGRPRGRPRIVARRAAGGDVRVWASWNGATEIRSWRVLAGPRPGSLDPVGDGVPFADLETRLRVATRGRYVAVRAHDGAGNVLGRSAAVRVR